MTDSRPRREFPDGGPWTWGAPAGTAVYGWTPGASPPDLSAPPPLPPAPAQPDPPVQHSAQPDPIQPTTEQETVPAAEQPRPTDDEPQAWPDAGAALPPALGPALTPEERYHQLHGWHGPQDG